MATFFLAKELAFAGIILAISFFVLLGARKANAKGLKMFGYIIAIILWASIALSAAMLCTKSSMKPCMPGMKDEQGMYNKKMMRKKGKGADKMMRKKKMMRKDKEKMSKEKCK